MSSSLLDWFKELDQLGWYAPKDFDHKKELDEVRDHQSTIEELLGFKLMFDNYAQDSARLTSLSTHTEVYWDSVLNVNTQRLLFCISFCTLGRMVVVYGEELQKHSEKLPALYDYLERSNYAVVDQYILDEPYSGKDANHAACKN